MLAIAVGDAHCEAAAGMVDALIVADVSRMASLIIMGQLLYCGDAASLLWLQRIDRANVFAGFGTCLFERPVRGETCVFADSTDAARNDNSWQACTRRERLALLGLIAADQPRR